MISGESIAFSALVLAAAAQSAEENRLYPEFAAFMAFYGYSWEAFTLTTEDDYILTTFHITGKDGFDIERDPELKPVLLMPGQGTDSTSAILPGMHPVSPLVLQLFDSGFDVWLANNRGTKYSQGHKTLTLQDPEYWAFGWAEMGMYDSITNVQFVKEQTGKKVSFIGVSQGTVQMFYALTKLEDEILGEALWTFAAIDPCTIQLDEGQDIYWDGLFHFKDYGIYAFNGPNWAEDKQTICDNFSEDVCSYAKMYGNPLFEPISVQTNEHWAQNVIANRYQEYSTDFTPDNTETELIDLSKIHTVPVTIWSGLKDGECYNSQAAITAETIGERCTYFRTVPWATHVNWGGPASVGLYKELTERLINPEKKSYPLTNSMFLH